MKAGWGARPSVRRAVAGLVVLTLLPTAILLATVPNAAAGHSVVTQDSTAPTELALQRGMESGLFAPFAWNGQSVYGPFVQFNFVPATGEITAYSAVNPADLAPLVDVISFASFEPVGLPTMQGATFSAKAEGLELTAHDEPMALLEIQTLGTANTVSFRFADPGMTITAVSNSTNSTVWPESTLAFTSHGSHGRIILGEGTFSVNGTVVTASMAAHDYLALKAVPSFTTHPAERSAMLDAFSSGRLAAEFALVAMSEGGWVENSAQFRASLQADSLAVVPDHAVIGLGSSAPEGGLLLLSFDPATMPTSGSRELVVQLGGVDVPQTSNAFGPIFAAPGSVNQASFAILPMNATVLAIYLPNLQGRTLTVESLPAPSPGLDAATQAAMVAAVFVVSVAAAVMFRRHGD